MYLTADEAVYVMPIDPSGAGKEHVMRMKLEGANTESAYVGVQLLEGRTNYLRGNDESQWRTEVPSYAGVRYEEVYPGVDMIWKGSAHGIGATQYDLVVKPGADSKQISLRFAGADALELDADGNLLIRTAVGVLRQNRPNTHQLVDGVRREVESGFRIDGMSVSFNLGEYDHSQAVNIEPPIELVNPVSLTYSSFLGGTSNDEGYGIAIDAVGSAYVAGFAHSTNFPTTSGTYQTTSSGTQDVVVTKLNAEGTAMVYSTYIGGGSEDRATKIAVDAAGNAFITGITQSANYPIAPGAFDASHNGFEDVFVTKLNAAGSGLAYSTFVGGSSSDAAFGLAVDLAGNAFVTGSTLSSDYPASSGVHNGSRDVFVTKLNAAGSVLSYSALLGGSSNDEGYAIAVDAVGHAFITGLTQSTNYPTTDGAYDRVHNGFGDAFIAKLNSNGAGLLYSTFVGGNSTEFGAGIAVDGGGSAYITGPTFSIDYPTTISAFDTTHNGNRDVFVTKLNAAGSDLSRSTFIGGSNSDEAYGIAIDTTGNAFVAGTTESANYPTTGGAFQASFSGVRDVFLTKLNAFGTGLAYSTFIGGSSVDLGQGITIDAAGHAFVTGSTFSGNFPITSGAFDTTHNGTLDLFVTKLQVPDSIAPRADFDGDGRSDLSVFRSADSNWYLNRSINGFGAIKWGIESDMPIPGDYDGDSRADLAVFRPDANPANGDYHVLNSNGFTVAGASWGLPGDIPVSGDYDGDGKSDFALFRPADGVWYILSRDGSSTATSFGLPGDVPMAFDLENDGRTNLAVFRPSENRWYIARNTGIPAENFESMQFGIAGDKLVPADYDGDNRDDIAVFRPSTGQWIVRRSSDGVVVFTSFGFSTDIPVPGDYDGDGRDDIAVYRNGQWWLDRTTSGLTVVEFGLATDTPIPSKYIP